MNETEEDEDGREWGWMCEGVFRPLSKRLLKSGALGPPPFVVELTSGEKREVIYKPSNGTGTTDVEA